MLRYILLYIYCSLDTKIMEIWWIFLFRRERTWIYSSMELCRFSTNCTFAGQCIFRTMPRHGLRDEFKADRASGRRAGRLRFQDGAACIPRLIIPAIFYYGRAFIYHARIVNRGTLHRGREEPRVPIRSTAGLNQIRPLSISSYARRRH